MKKKSTRPAPYLKMAADALYDLDEKIGMEFHNKTPRLFMTCTHGYILAELCEIRALISAALKVKK